MATATELSPEIWNAVADSIDRSQAPREITFAKVAKRDQAKKLVWVEEFGNLGIPLVTFTSGFAYYDTDATGAVNKKEDRTGKNDAYHTQIIAPRVGQMVVILDPGGQHRFPICVGVLQSSGFWQGEG